MKSIQFTDSMVGTGYGRGSTSHRSLKKSSSSCSVLSNNWRGINKRQKCDDSPKDDGTLSMLDDDAATASVLAAAVEDDSKILKEALEYLDSESLEKARRTYAMLSCMQVRDAILSLKGQIDSVPRRSYHAKEGSERAEALL